MVRKSQENLRVIESSKTIFLLLAVLIAGAALPGAVFACDVTSVTLYLGRTQVIALGHNTSTVYIASGDSFWFHVHWGADTPDDQGFDLVIYDYSTSETLTTRSITSPTQRTYTGSTTLQTYSFVPHTIKAKMRRKPSGDWFWSSGRILTVVKVDKVVESGTTDEGPLYVVCADDTVSLEAKPNPAGASFPTGEPHWTIESQPGTSASLSPSSGSATTTLSGLTEPGDYSVKAKCGDFDTGDTIVVTTPPSSGYWEDFMPRFSCPPKPGETNQVAKPDDCENRLAIYCDSNNSGGFEAFSWWYRPAGETGRGTEVGICVWTGGVNIFDYKVTDETNYGKERYLQTRHVTQNDAEGIDGHGEGCDGYWCWRVEKYDCVNEAPVVHDPPLGSSPWWRRRVGSAGGSEYHGEPCPGPDPNTGEPKHPCYPN